MSDGDHNQMPLRKLAEGFLRFRAENYETSREMFERLAQKQEPKVMMIACSDSRVDPGILCNAEPGDLFMVRNVANLVPPYAWDKSYHGTSAALEFAVTALKVEHIVVLGHGGCGGIKALYTAPPEVGARGSFIANWMQIADEARRRTLLVAGGLGIEEQLRICGEEAIKTSLANLLSFPWIAERVNDGKLRIHGWRFGIRDGIMSVYVPRLDRFAPLTLELAAELQNG
jgi:carbonic anhydrase